MPAWKPCLIAPLLAAWFGTLAEAQGVVPGGWGPQVGFQTFANPGAAGGIYAGNGYGYGYDYGVQAPGFVTPGMGGFVPIGPAVRPTYPIFIPPSRTVNAIDPLIGSIRRSTARKGGW